MTAPLPHPAGQPRRRAPRPGAWLALALLAPLAAPAQNAPAPASAEAAAAPRRFVMPEGLTPAQQARLERFRDFQIKGVCGGVADYAQLSRLGVNAFRNYTIPSAEETRADLDRAQQHGIYLIVSEWMPHQGANRGEHNSTWNYDYDEKGEELFANFIQKLEGIGDHPALLMWGLGNEVHLDEPYLRLANRLSLAIHERFPLHLTSLTMINAKPENIAKVKEFAPDIDVLGVQSYSPGAVRGSIRNAETHWGRAFYVSEFNGKGPWNFGKTDWGEPQDEPVSVKVADLRDSYGTIDASGMCLGSTIFVWGHYMEDRPSYFSLLLTEHPDGNRRRKVPLPLMMTPQAEAMAEHFTGRPLTGNRAPVLTALKFADGTGAYRARPGETVGLRPVAEDANGDAPTFTAWILNREKRNTRAVAGPARQAADGTLAIDAPREPGPYLVMIYAMDGRGGASASTLPLLVEDPAAPAAEPAQEPAPGPIPAPGP